MKRTKKNIRHVKTKEDMKKALADIASAPIISYDLETGGLDPFAPGAYITSVGISTKEYDWAFLLNHYLSDIFEDWKAQSKLMRKINKAVKGKKMVAHNGKFDYMFVRVLYGYKWDIYFDTMLAHYNLNENIRHGLKEITLKEGWNEGYDIPLSAKHGLTGTIEEHIEYLAEDTFDTLRLYYKYRRKLRLDKGTYDIFWNITMPASKMYCEAQFHGVYIDSEKLAEAKIYWSKKVEVAKRVLDDLHPSDNKWKNKKTKEWEYGVNWGSPDQLAEILFNKMGIEPIAKTPKGKPSTSESVLQQLAKEHEIAKQVLDYRGASKNLNTFIEPWERQMTDSRIHPNFKIHGTVTGRPSCIDPNLQQVPRDPRIRSIITAPPGWVLLDVDYSQADLRIVAEMAQCPVLLLAYQTGLDIHGKTVQELFGIPTDKQTKEERKKGKAVNFGFVYGMWWKKFVQYALDNYDSVFTDKEAEKVRKDFFRTYPGLAPWHKTQKAFANKNGYVRSILGRIRRLPDAMREPTGGYDAKKSEAERQAVNSPVQSFASDLTLMAAIQMHNEFDKKYLKVVGSVHDSVLMECREDMVEEVAPRILEIMRRPKLLDELDIRLSVPLVGDLEVGPWASGVEWAQK